MANSAKTSSAVVGTTIEAMVKEGKALARIWKQTNSLKDSTKANGFDTRLGKLLQQLKASSTVDSGQISRQALRDHGIHTIDRRRRAEALWFVENETECRAFIANSKKGFSSLTALQAAMRKAAKADGDAAVHAVLQHRADRQAEPSNVGQSSEAKQSGATEQRSVTVQVTRSKMVDTILHHCAANGLNIEDIINDLQSHVAKQQRETAKMVKTI